MSAQFAPHRALLLAWTVLFAGAWFPFLALGAAYLGWTLREVDRFQAAIMMLLGPLLAVVGIAEYFL